MQLPKDLLNSLQGISGFDAPAFIAAHQEEEPVVSIRLNPNKPAELSGDWQMTGVPWCEEGRYLSQRPFFTHDPLLHAGAYYVQEASSMFIRQILPQLYGRDENIQVMDLCAAPGGKSTLLASYFQQALIVANEVIRTRVPILNENLIKWGSPHVVVTNNDPAQIGRLSGFFDLMLVDAPCSGSGLFRKDPAVVDGWSYDQVNLCSRRQHRILEDVLPALKEGGYLIYATCSFSPEENEEITRWLVEEMEMEAVPIQINSAWGVIESSYSGSFRFFPGQIKGEGFYVSVLRKKRPSEYYSGRNVLLDKISRDQSRHFESLFGLEARDHIFQQAGMVRFIPSEHVDALSTMAGCLYIRRAGVELGQEKGKDIVPSHEWAMMWGKKQGWPIVEVDHPQAMAFLGRQVLELSVDKGWNLLTYNNLVLGWVKNAGSRINNYYPADWRIRKMPGG